MGNQNTKSAYPTISLTPEEREQIAAVLAQANGALQRRARLLLLYDDGKPTRDAAAGAGYSRGRARYWRRQFQLHGMGIFPGLEQMPPPVPVPPTEKKARKPVVSTAKGRRQQAEQAILERAAAIPFPLPYARAGVDPDDELTEACRKILLHQFAEMLSHEEGTKLGEDIEALHDMRVATRRMRAALLLFNEAFDPEAIKPQRKGLRDAGRALGEARDWDVFIEKAVADANTKLAGHTEGLQPMLNAWEAARAAARQQLYTLLNSEKYQTFKLLYNLFLHTPGAGRRSAAPGQISPRRVRDVAPAMIYTRLEAVRTYEAILPFATLTQLHELRMEAKKLRYALEFFREVLGPEAREAITELKALQDHLGELHDADVACQIIRQFLDSWEAEQSGLPLAERASSQPIVAYLAARHADRHQLLTGVPAAWERFNRPEVRRCLALAVSVL